MKLVGMLDSPYIRRTAISLSYLGVPFAHQAVSVFGNLEIDIARTNWVSLREQVSQAEITAAMVWRFVQGMLPDIVVGTEFPALQALAQAAEKLPAFMALPL